METTVLITACILIGLGVLVKRFPMLIAGYNTLSKEERDNIDVKGLSTFMCYSLVGMGIVPLLVYYICLGIGHADWAGMSLLIPLPYIPFLIYKANCYDKAHRAVHNSPKRSRRYVVSFSVLIVVVVGVLMFYGTTPSTVRLENGKFVFTGMFGTSRLLNDIEGIKLTNALPKVSLRLNGLSVGGINKGKFKLADGGSCFMYLSSSSKPYIVFSDKNGQEIYYNSKDSVSTIQIYQDLSRLFRD